MSKCLGFFGKMVCGCEFDVRDQSGGNIRFMRFIRFIRFIRFTHFTHTFRFFYGGGWVVVGEDQNV